MTPIEFAQKMKDIKKRAKKDPDGSNAEALDLMLHALKMSGYVSGVEVYEKIQKYYALRKANG